MKGIKARYAYNEIIFYIKYIRKAQQNMYKGNKRKRFIKIIIVILVGYIIQSL